MAYDGTMHTQQGPGSILRDGTAIRFRPIEPNDRGRLLDAFNQLSATSRNRRFLAPIASLSDEQLHAFTHVDHIDHVAWVAELSAEPARPVVGVGRWVRSPADRRLAEIAITVIDAYQGLGLGRLLLELLLTSAAERGVDWFEAIVLGENLPMRSLLRSYGARQVGYAMGAYVYRFEVSSTRDEPRQAA